MAMKFKTFRAILLVVALLILIAGGAVMWGAVKSSRAKRAEKLAEVLQAQLEAERLAAIERAKNPPPTPTSGGASGAPAGGRLDPVSAQVLQRALQGIGGTKAKDAMKGAAFKVNFYADGSSPGQVTRLKLDLNRNNAWDEKWTFETPGSAEGIKRQVSSSDDGNYDKEYQLQGGAWVAKGGTDVPAPAQPAPGGGDALALRPMDSKILAKVKAGISGAKLKDPWPQSWKVNLYSDSKDGVVTRLKVDLDRDNKSDEKWTISREGGVLKVKRKVSSGDDDTLYDREYRLRDGKWAVKN
jgi:type II secretory pathway pseudopilin PulG